MDIWKSSFSINQLIINSLKSQLKFTPNLKPGIHRPYTRESEGEFR